MQSTFSNIFILIYLNHSHLYTQIQVMAVLVMGISTHIDKQNFVRERSVTSTFEL